MLIIASILGCLGGIAGCLVALLLLPDAPDLVRAMPVIAGILVGCSLIFIEDHFLQKRLQREVEASKARSSIPST